MDSFAGERCQFSPEKGDWFPCYQDCSPMGESAFSSPPASIWAPGHHSLSLHSAPLSQWKLPDPISSTRVWSRVEKVTLEIALLLKLENYLSYYWTQEARFYFEGSEVMCERVFLTRPPYSATHWCMKPEGRPRNEDNEKTVNRIILKQFIKLVIMCNRFWNYWNKKKRERKLPFPFLNDLRKLTY